MTGPTLHARALALFDELLELDAAERTRRLAALARADPALHAETSALLAADQFDHGLLERAPVLPDGERQDDEPDDGADALLGRHIGPWRIDGIVGRGGMGAVYRGERDDGQFRQRAAIKLIRLGMDDAQSRRRFLRERQILAGLQHPNIAALLDGGVTDAGAPYFAMELVDGLPIDRHCDQRGLGLRARMRLFLQVCAAVQYAHQNLVVHRDLKPGNILVTEDGQARLLDFGIAKLLEGDNLDTHTRSRALTPEYAAPEQLRGEAITTAADVYALGVLLYGLLADAHPYMRDGRNPVRRQLALPEREPEPITHAAARIDAEAARARGLTPRALAAALRGDLAAIVHRCLQAEPARRYASVEMLANDLHAWLEGRPVTARAGHRGYRLRKFVVRHRWGVAAGATAVLAICGALGVALVQARNATLQAERNAHTRDFVVTLFENANPTRSDRGAKLTAAELLTAAAQRVDTGLADAPRTQGQLRAAIGYSLLRLGEVARGRQLLERGVAQLRTAPGEPPASLAAALQNLSMARETVGDLDGAERAVKEAIALLETAPGDHRLTMIKLRTSLSSLLRLRGRVGAALAENLRIQRDRAALLGADDPATAVDWNNLGSTYIDLDRCSEAEHAYLEARERVVRGLGATHPRNAWILLGLGSARGCMGRHAQAEADFAAAQALILEAFSAQHPLAIRLHAQRGALAYRQGKAALAVEHYTRALALARELQHSSTAHVEGRLGMALLAHGDAQAAQARLAAALADMTGVRRGAADPVRLRYRAAHGLALFLTGHRDAGERELRDALAGFQDTGLTASEDYAESAGDLATLLEARGTLDEAATWRRHAQDAFVRTFGPLHPRSVQAAQRLAEADSRNHTPASRIDNPPSATMQQDQPSHRSPR